MNVGHQPSTSTTASEMSTHGIIASTHLRRSIRDGGSSTAFTLATWILPSSSMVTEVSAASPARNRPTDCSRPR
ncbi:hypothetical protein [Nonomuraea aridisoli]|uniref:Uncharacterized protein n=1 Tax=Nonomuraea aridisoli TaxID=2070368 RepID=A0A2W2DQU4_9ACTN|nr:hypothetical protein [Nonomuraea aridisoli]PZG07505.1 hypothetical protein C1J01_40535 [Nonomuraea aridisoli]